MWLNYNNEWKMFIHFCSKASVRMYMLVTRTFYTKFFTPVTIRTEKYIETNYNWNVFLKNITNREKDCYIFSLGAILCYNPFVFFFFLICYFDWRISASIFRLYLIRRLKVNSSYCTHKITRYFEKLMPRSCFTSHIFETFESFMFQHPVCMHVNEPVCSQALIFILPCIQVPTCACCESVLL